MTGFVDGVGLVLKSSVTKYLVLGDKDHGMKGLKCLAAAVEDGALQSLDKYGVGTVLFEGPQRGQEMSYDHGSSGAPVTTLSTTGVRVVGCEDDASLATHAAMGDLYDNASTLGAQEFGRQHALLLDKRMPDANDSWIAQATKVEPKAIICCGTSHLPSYDHHTYGHIGIVKTLHQRGCCYGFAVEDSNTDSDFWYVPEKKTGRFGQVETIDAYPGWNS